MFNKPGISVVNLYKYTFRCTDHKLDRHYNCYMAPEKHLSTSFSRHPNRKKSNNLVTLNHHYAHNLPNETKNIAMSRNRVFRVFFFETLYEQTLNMEQVA